MNEKESIKEIEKEITEIKDSWPAHSSPPSMLLRLEELEEQLAQLKKILKGECNASAQGGD
jgi:Mg2+ and Co2+ transporter CorA